MSEEQYKPPMEVLLTMEVRDKDGNLISSKTRPSHSFTLNFLTAILDLFNAPSASTIGVSSTQSTDGFTRNYPNINSTNNPLMYVAGAVAGTTTYGIQIGTGTVQTYVTASKLSNQVITGWTYNAIAVDQSMSFGTPAGQASFNVSRSFVNGTGGTVVITEVGLVVNITSTVNYNMLILYDSGNNTSVPSGSTLTVKYTLQTTM